MEKTQFEKLIRQKAETLFKEKYEKTQHLIRTEVSLLLVGYSGYSSHTLDAFVKEINENKQKCIEVIERDLSNQVLNKMQELKYFFEGQGL